MSTTHQTSPLQEASRDARAAALFIDLALRTLSFFAIAGLGVGLKNVTLVTLAPLSLGVSVVLLALVDAVLLTWRGQTLGQRIVGIYIARPDGARASFHRVVMMRSVLPGVMTLLPYFGLFWLFLDHLWALGSERRAVHDRLADTAVFVRRATPQTPPRSPKPS